MSAKQYKRMRKVAKEKFPEGLAGLVFYRDVKKLYRASKGFYAETKTVVNGKVVKSLNWVTR